MWNWIQSRDRIYALFELYLFVSVSMLQRQTQETRQREVVLHSPELRALGEKVKLCKLIVKRPKKDWGQGRGRECSQFNQETKLCKDDW